MLCCSRTNFNKDACFFLLFPCTLAALRASFRNLYLHAMPGRCSWVPVPNLENCGVAVPSPDLWELLVEAWKPWHPMKQLNFPLCFQGDSPHVAVGLSFGMTHVMIKLPSPVGWAGWSLNSSAVALSGWRKLFLFWAKLESPQSVSASGEIKETHRDGMF